MADYLPHSDLRLGQWAKTFAVAVGADPAGYGLTDAQAAAYSAAQQGFAQALSVINNPSTRTPVAVAAKNAARQELITQSRRCAAVVQAYAGTTDTMRLELGLTIRKKRARMAGVPLNPPQIRVLATESVMGDRVKLRISAGGASGGGDSGGGASGGGGRPRTAKGYTLYSYIGDHAPTALRQWSFEGNGVGREHTVKLPADVPAGSTVHFVAQWFNARMQPGPLSQAVTTRVAGSKAARLPVALAA